MALAQRDELLLTDAEYLALDLSSDRKWELLDGRPHFMAGANLTHNRIVGNTLGVLHSGLRGSRCFAVGSDQRVKPNHRQTYTYPDVVVFCGKPVLSGDSPETATNPVVLIEVTSRSTADRDRTVKLDRYLEIPSLADYLIVDQFQPRVEWHHRLEGEKWLREVKTSLDDTIELESIGATLALSDLYEGVEFEAQEERDTK